MMFDFAISVPFVVTFFFVFAVVFGLLQSIKQFFPKNANVLIALVFGFVAASYFPFSELLMEVLPFAAGILVFLFLFVFARKVIEGEKKEDQQSGKKTSYGTTLVILGTSLLIVAVAWGYFAYRLDLGYTFSNDMLWALGITIIVLMLYAGTRADQ